MSKKYERIKKELNDKKEKLFMSNDTSLWKLAPDTPKTVTELKTKKIEAFYYMLPNETKELNDLKDNFAFMNR